MLCFTRSYINLYNDCIFRITKMFNVIKAKIIIKFRYTLNKSRMRLNMCNIRSFFAFLTIYFLWEPNIWLSHYMIYAWICICSSKRPLPPGNNPMRNWSLKSVSKWLHWQTRKKVIVRYALYNVYLSLQNYIHPSLSFLLFSITMIMVILLNIYDEIF